MLDANTIFHIFQSENEAEKFDRAILVAKMLLQAVERAEVRGPGNMHFRSASVQTNRRGYLSPRCYHRNRSTKLKGEPK